MKRITYSFTYSDFENFSELHEDIQELIRLTRDTARLAYAPYSKFCVGAIVLLDNGTIIKGNNQENAAFPSGLCAERVAIFTASANHPNSIIKSISISAYSTVVPVDKPIPPCGNCRQVLMEYEKRQKSPIKVILSGEQGQIVTVDRVSHLLPLSFTDDYLCD